MYIAARLSSAVFGVVTTAVLTRLLEPERYGIYALVLVFMTLGSTIVFDWLGQSFLRFYQARREDPKLAATFATIFMLLVAASGLLLGVVWLFGFVAAGEAQIAIVGLILVWTASWFESRRKNGHR